MSLISWLPKSTGARQPIMDRVKTGLKLGDVKSAERNFMSKTVIREDEMDDEFKSFIALVRAMRKEQKFYFMTRSPDVLSSANQLEADVDRELTRLSRTERQATFFPKES